MSADDQRALGKAAAHLDRLDDPRAVGGRGTGRRTLGPTPAIGQVVAHRQPAAARPFVANTLQQCGIPATAGAVGEHDYPLDASGVADGFVRDARDLVEVHDSRNSGETGPWPWPSG